MEHYQHLNVTSRAIINQDIKQRIEFVERGRQFQIDRHERILEYFSNRVGRFQYGKLWKPICHLASTPGMGASTIAKKLAHAFPDSFDAKSKTKCIPILYTHLPYSGDIQELIYEINQELGLPNIDYSQKIRLINKTFDFLNTLSLETLIIDDCDAIRNWLPRERHRFLDILRYSGSRFGFQIILIGGRHSHEYLLEYDQLASRTEFASLETFKKDDPDFIALLDDFESWCPLQYPSKISADKMLRAEIIYRNSGSLRQILDGLCDVAKHSIWSGQKRITFYIWRENFG